jgi:nitroreductase
MDIRKVVRERRSIRNFKPDPIPETLIREILDESRWSPSWGNTQPWEYYVLTGDPLEKFKKANREKMQQGVPFEPDIRMPENWTEKLKKRYTGVGRSTLESLSIAREDTAARAEYTQFMYYLFDAPCLIVACIDKCSASIEYALLDVGLAIQTLCLLAHDRGIGTCIMACAVRYPSLLRGILPHTENKLMVMGVALGYPGLSSPINHFERQRAPLEESVIWVK